jgi:4'-phosphopantetheinyl transferase
LFTSSPIPYQALGPNEVHVWHLRAEQVTDPRVLQRFEALLAPDERERHGRFVHERTRAEYLLARGLARTVLAGYTGMSPAALRFTADAFGKPLLREPLGVPGVQFNLSHSHGVIVCAAALGRQVGIDVEDGGRRMECLDLAERYFAPAEVAHLRTLHGDARQAAFFTIWTLKEAFVKAIGHGLSFPLDAFAFELEQGRLRRFVPPSSLPGSWRFFQFEPTPRHCGALAVACNGVDIRVVMRDWMDVFLPSPLWGRGVGGEGEA